MLFMTNQQLDCGDLLQCLWLLKPEGLFIGADVKINVCDKWNANIFVFWW